MKRKSVSKILMVTIQVVVFCFALAGASALAQFDDTRSRDRHCSNRTLSGDYGFSVEGQLSPAPGVTLAGRGVTMTHFDGEGQSDPSRLPDYQRESGQRLEPCYWHVSRQ